MQLLLLNLQKNQILLLTWVFLFGVILEGIATKYGLSHLFLTPEYQGEQSVLSYGIVGFSLGGFILAYNLYSYIMHSSRFPFLATLNRPLVKFSINNFLVPLAFIITYVYQSVQYQLNLELLSPTRVVIHLLGFFAGIFLFQLISSLYFITTNKSVAKLIQKEKEEEFEPQVTTALPQASQGKRSSHFKKVLTYMNTFFSIRLARASSHYEKELLEKVLAQNHINASLFEIVTVISFIIIGSFGETHFFEIPASASIILMLTTVLMIFSAFYSWFKGWTATFIIVLLLFANYQLVKVGWLRAESKAYGLDYNMEPASYEPLDLMLDLQEDSLSRKDFEEHIAILENWRKKNLKESLVRGKKPKLVVICTSGGGSRSALWTMTCMSHLDSLSEGALLNNTHLITGSSGGLIGATYLRELYRQKQLYPDSINFYEKAYRDNISKDILNPMIFRMATNDIFIRYQKFRLNDQIYTKDRGFAFENTLNENTNGVLWKSMGDYQRVEKESVVPLLVMSPTIVNDGRRMVIASQPMSFLSSSDWIETRLGEPIMENVEFRRLFKKHKPDELMLTSALRMNATFPFIMPSVNLPSEPSIELMDAGLRDNFGIKLALDYLYTFRNWISTNTSGVVLVQIRDKQKNFQKRKDSQSIWSEFTAPLGSVYGNYTRMQDFTNEQLFKFFKESVDYPIELCEFQLQQDESDVISLSWHLTKSEKVKISSSINLPKNKVSAEQLLRLLEAN